jgi:hypothetical protein
VIETQEAATTVNNGSAILSNIKSRKENQASPLAGRSISATAAEKPLEREETAQKVSQAIIPATNSGTKRQRVITPAAAKAIDDEDEPRSSPSTRKVSRASAKQDGPEPRRVLSNLTNVGGRE